MSLTYFSRDEIEYVKGEFYKELEKYDCTGYNLNDSEDVIIINDSLILFVSLTEGTATEVQYEGTKYYSLYIEELLYNEIGFKHDNTKFRNEIASHFNVSYIPDKEIGCSSITYAHFRGFNPVYWSDKQSLPQCLEKEVPELKLKERYDAWEGIHYFFIVIEFVNTPMGTQRGVAYTECKPHSYITTLGKKYIQTGNISNDIRHDSEDFFKSINALKGISRKDRLEKNMQYFFFEHSFREKDDVWKYADKILEKANKNEFEKIPRSTYIKPTYKWTSEELCLKLTKKLYKDSNVLYQYRPFFLRSSFGGQMSYDIFIQDLKVAIEYQGKQHFEPVDFFGGKEAFEKTQKRDKEKKELSEKHGIKLVYINFDEPITADLIKTRIEKAKENKNELK